MTFWQDSRLLSETLIDFFAVAAVITSISLLAGYLVGLRTEHARAEADVAWLRSELRQANDRLFAASREPGVVIPPRDEPKDPIPELPSELERLISDWESPQSQEELRRQFMSMMEKGVSPAEIKRLHLES